MSMRYICKITWTSGQCRITIPKIIAKKMNLKEIQFVVISNTDKETITIRGIKSEKDFKAKNNGC
jgi:bifunctional DNA-binding transcriptional regulator/antitoxin component of YhaV-PrlF toxin-antitoxin module